jgi:hypothetical protein
MQFVGVGWVWVDNWREQEGGGWVTNMNGYVGG